MTETHVYHWCSGVLAGPNKYVRVFFEGGGWEAFVGSSREGSMGGAGHFRNVYV